MPLNSGILYKFLERKNSSEEKEKNLLADHDTESSEESQQSKP